MVSIRFADYMRRESPGSTVDRPHGSGDYLFLYFPYPMNLLLESGRVTTKNNACVLFAPYDMHFLSGAPDFLNSFVHFKPDFPVTVKTGHVFYPDNYEEINETLRRITAETVMPDELSAQMREALIRELLVLTARGQKNEQGDPLFKRFYDLKMKMLKDPGKNYSSEELASLVYMSRTQFFEYYRRFFNSSPKKDMQKMKMEKARTLLSDRSKTVLDVAMSVGYSSVEHFTRCYKEYFGHSPRTKHQ